MTYVLNMWNTYVLTDCTPDLSRQVEMTLILRCVNISISLIKIDEHFVEFLKVDNTSRKGLFNEIINAIKNLELDINDVHGQRYDNGSNMKGKKQRVQKRILDINPKAFYRPCGCHNLNLSYVIWLILILKLYLFLE